MRRCNSLLPQYFSKTAKFFGKTCNFFSYLNILIKFQNAEPLTSNPSNLNNPILTATINGANIITLPSPSSPSLFLAYLFTSSLLVSNICKNAVLFPYYDRFLNSSSFENPAFLYIKISITQLPFAAPKRFRL